MRVLTPGRIQEHGVLVRLCSRFIKNTLNHVHVHTFAFHFIVISKKLTGKLMNIQEVINYDT